MTVTPSGSTLSQRGVQSSTAPLLSFPERESSSKTGFFNNFLRSVHPLDKIIFFCYHERAEHYSEQARYNPCGQLHRAAAILFINHLTYSRYTFLYPLYVYV